MIILAFPIASYGGVIGIKCGEDRWQPLSIYEGNFINDESLEIPTTDQGVLFTELLNLKKYELRKFNKIRDLVFRTFQNTFPSKLSAVMEAELLFDQRSHCQYQRILEWKAKTLMRSVVFESLSKKDQIFSLIESYYLLLSSEYRPIGLRSYVYSKLAGLDTGSDEKHNIELRKNAGLFYLEKGPVVLDLKKKLRFDVTTNELLSAFPVLGSDIEVENTDCKVDYTKAASFTMSQFRKATIANNCSLSVGGNKYITKKNSLIYKFTNGSTESIYLKPGFKISNSDVELEASFLVDKPSRLLFSFSGSGKVVQYVRFTGKAKFYDNWVRIKDYTNIGVFDEGRGADALVLADLFQLETPVGKLELGGYSWKASTGRLILSQLAPNKIQSIKVMGKTLKLKPYSLIYFYTNHRPKKIVLNKAANLTSVNGQTVNVKAGVELTLSPSGRLIEVGKKQLIDW